MPDYSKAHERLQDFVNEVQGWDGDMASPACPEIAVEVTWFLKRVEALGIDRPSLTLSTSGSVIVTWKKESLQAIVTFNYLGSAYVTVVLAKNPKADSWKASYYRMWDYGMLSDEFVQILRENFLEGNE